VGSSGKTRDYKVGARIVSGWREELLGWKRDLLFLLGSKWPLFGEYRVEKNSIDSSKAPFFRWWEYWMLGMDSVQ